LIKVIQRRPVVRVFHSLRDTLPVALSLLVRAVAIFCSSPKSTRHFGPNSGVPAGLAGEVRRSVAGARLHIDHRHAELEFDPARLEPRPHPSCKTETQMAH
jgi:hypothetical protein